MRATSRNRVTAPPGDVLITMSPNSSSPVSRPRALIGSCWSVPGSAGEAPTTPPATLTFCSRMACTTSLAVSSRAATLSGSSHTRIE